MAELKDTPRSLRRLRSAAGIFLFLLLSGIFPWLAPRTLAAQWALLLHTVVGLAALVPLTVIVWRHGRVTQRLQGGGWLQTGWLTAAGWALVAATGVGLLGVGLFASRMPYWLHGLHLGLGLAVGALALWHVVRGLVRSGFVRRRFARPAVPVAAGLALVMAGGGGLWYARRPLTHPADFAPSNARADHDRTIPASLLANSASCGRCHADIYRQWLPGAHHYSSTDVFYQEVRTNYIQQRGTQAVRYCAGCHEPITLLSGVRFAPGVQPHAEEGSSCAFCHALRKLQTRGNANYVVMRPQPYLFERSSNPLLHRVSDALIRLHPDGHKLDYAVAPSRTVEFCGTCHKQYIDKHENGFGFVQLQNQLDDWKNGPWHTNAARRLQCQDCHMRKIASNDPGRDAQGMISDHNILASNSYMAEMLHLQGGAQHDAAVRAWMRGQTHIPEIAGRWGGGPIVAVELQPETAAIPGQTARLRAIVTNTRVGHAFPTGPLDLIQSWIELTITDVRTGAVVYRSGYLDASGAVTGPTIQYHSTLLSRQAQPIFDHELWNAVGGREKRMVLPGMSDTLVYSFPVPRGLGGPLKCTARLLYRRYNEHAQQALVAPDLRGKIPVLTLATTSSFIPVEQGGARAASEGAAR